MSKHKKNFKRFCNILRNIRVHKYTSNKYISKFIHVSKLLYLLLL